jgi:hypothetical protein
MTNYSLATIADRWRQYGRSRAVHPTLWDGSLMLSTIGPQTTSERTTCRDYSGRNNHGTLTGATHLPTWGNQSCRGQSFRGLTFDGTEDYVNFGNPASLQLPGPFSVACWANCNSVSTYRFAVGNTNSSAMQRNYALYLDKTTAKLYFVFTQGVAVYRIASSAGAVSLNTWTHLCGVYDLSTIRVFVDGIQVGQANQTGAADTNIGSCSIGRSGAFTTDYYWSGQIASTAIFQKSLTASEISILSQHPLTAYAVRLPEYFTFTGAPSSAKYWMWARQQSTQVISGGLT